MKPVPDTWLAGAEDVTRFHRAVCAAHEAPASSAAYHQWHYAVDARLLALVNHWHATRQCAHLAFVDQFFDTPDRQLRASKARLRKRQLYNHSERRHRAYEGIGGWTLRREAKRVEHVGVVWEIWHDFYVVRSLQEDFKLVAPANKAHVSPLNFCSNCGKGVWRNRYQPKEESNPRWWIQETYWLHHPDSPCGLELVVEADPAARGWDSDEDEVIEYGKEEEEPVVAHGWESGDDERAVPQRQIHAIESCRGCVYHRLPEYKDGHGRLVPDVARPVIWGKQVRMPDGESQY